MLQNLPQPQLCEPLMEWGPFGRVVPETLLKRAQIARHIAKQFQQNRFGKFAAARIACTAECHSADISLSARHSFSASYRSVRAGAFAGLASLPKRRFPPPWSVHREGAGPFIVTDAKRRASRLRAPQG